MSDSSTGERPAWAGPHVPRLPDGSQDQVRQWVRRLVELTGWSASGLATEAGVVPSTVNRFLNAPVKHNLSTTTLNKLRAAAGPRIAERIEAGEIEPTAPGSVDREPPASAAAEAVAQALVHLPEIVADPAAFDAARRLIGADRRRGAALARLLPAGRAPDSGALRNGRAARANQARRNRRRGPVTSAAVTAGVGACNDMALNMRIFTQNTRHFCTVTRNAHSRTLAP